MGDLTKKGAVRAQTHTRFFRFTPAMSTCALPPRRAPPVSGDLRPRRQTQRGARGLQYPVPSIWRGAQCTSTASSSHPPLLVPFCRALAAALALSTNASRQQATSSARLLMPGRFIFLTAARAVEPFALSSGESDCAPHLFSLSLWAIDTRDARSGVQAGGCKQPEVSRVTL